MKSQIQEKSRQLAPELSRIRQHIHSHPELSFEEFETARFVESELTKLGISKLSRKATTGVIALIEGKDPESRTVALRADMDALPIQESNQVPYKSQNPGVMHACGHDVHTTCLLGAAAILQELRQNFTGTVKLVFQPGEEKIPGGASLLIKEGVLTENKVRQITGQHVLPMLPAGKVGFRSGLYMASADEIYVTVKGKGGHGAMPHLNIDPVLITAHMLTALQQIVSRGANPAVPSVLSFGKVIANGATNVIPNEVYLEGTFRTMDETWRAEAHRRMKQMAEQIAESMGGTCEFNIMRGYPFLKNEETLTAFNRQAAEEYLGPENVVDLGIWMAAEDFAYYSQEVPACFYRLGTNTPEGTKGSSVHTPTFDIDENALPLGAGLMAYLAWKQLNQPL